jgi:hypothetical protein
MGTNWKFAQKAKGRAAMPNDKVLITTVRFHDQFMRDVLSSREALKIVRDWVGEYIGGVGNVRSWTPYWKEILVRRPGNILLGFRFRLGGPVEVSQTYGWTYSEAERAEFEEALLPFLDELGRAMTQLRMADGIQSKHPNATRKVQDDDSILMQMKVQPGTSTLASPESLIDLAAIVRPDLLLQVFVRCQDETIGRATLRRFVADLQVAGLPVTESSEIVNSEKDPGDLA